MTTNTLVSLENIYLNFDKPALVDVSLSVQRNEIITIIGPNGAGKSSLIKVIAGLTPYSKGQRRVSDNLSIGYVPQKLHIDKGMPIKVSRFLSLAQAPKGLCKKSLEKVGASHLWSKQMHSLSGGELQRVLLARGIARKPDLLLLDEPLQGVDINGQLDLYKLIAKLRDDLNCAVVLISHDLHIVMAQTDKVICLNQHVCCSGEPENVSQHPEYLSLFGYGNAQNLAVYTHYHDHHHNLHGDFEDCGDNCKHD